MTVTALGVQVSYKLYRSESPHIQFLKQHEVTNSENCIRKMYNNRTARVLCVVRGEQPKICLLTCDNNSDVDVREPVSVTVIHMKNHEASCLTKKVLLGEV